MVLVGLEFHHLVLYILYVCSSRMLALEQLDIHNTDCREYSWKVVLYRPFSSKRRVCTHLPNADRGGVESLNCHIRRVDQVVQKA